jgi:hypothetical protein
MLALCLQAHGNAFGKGDIGAAVELAKLIADIEEDYRSDCFFMCVFSKKCPIDMRNACVQALSTKFKTIGYIARNDAEGHPYGSNMLWLSALTEAEGQWNEHQKVPKNRGSFPYNGVLTFEPDCVPLRKDWISALTKEWNERVIAAGEWNDEEANPEQGKNAGWPKYEVMGHRDDRPGNEHINGNMILRPDIRQRHTWVTRFTTNLGWDFCNKEQYLKVGLDTNLILQHYKRGVISRVEMPHLIKNGVSPALYHGVQGKVGQDARRFVREQLVEKGAASFAQEMVA